MSWYSRSTSYIFRFIVFIGITLGFLFFTNPNKLASVVLIVPFALLFVILYLLINGVMTIIHSHNDKIAGLHVRRPRVLSALVAAFPVLLLVLQSIGQLTIWDVISSGALFGLAYLYVAKASVSFFQ